MSKHLPMHDVVAIATRLATRLGMTIPSAEDVRVALNNRYDPPQLIDDGYAQLWIDKYYVAYSTLDDPLVHYVYLTDRHIWEERRSYKEARLARDNKVSLPQDIDRQFKKALTEMDAEGNRYVIFESV